MSDTRRRGRNPYPFRYHPKNHPERDILPWKKTIEEEYEIEPTIYPSWRNEPHDTASSTIEILAIVGAGVAAIAAIIYVVNRQSHETGQVIVQVPPPQP